MDEVIDLASESSGENPTAKAEVIDLESPEKLNDAQVPPWSVLWQVYYPGQPCPDEVECLDQEDEEKPSSSKGTFQDTHMILTMVLSYSFCDQLRH